VRGGGPGHMAVAATARAWRARAGSASVRERGPVQEEDGGN
jgi:hypothetical protein